MFIQLSTLAGQLLPEPVVRLAERHARRFTRFGLVGLSGVGVKTAALWVLVTVLGQNTLVGALISTEISILTNFALNDHWTFSDARPTTSYLRRALNYHAVTIGGTIASIALFAGLTEWIGIQYLLANLISIGAGTLSNYVLSLRLAWSLPVKSPVPTLASVADVLE